MHARHSSPLSNNKIKKITFRIDLSSCFTLYCLPLHFAAPAHSIHSVALYSWSRLQYLYSFTHIHSSLHRKLGQDALFQITIFSFSAGQPMRRTCSEHMHNMCRGCTTCAEDAYFLCTEPLHFHYVVITKYCLTVFGILHNYYRVHVPPIM